jgi:CDP-glycerol glycerophosphotransferase
VRIVWNSFHGRFSDSPRALWDRLADRTDIEHVWLADAAHRHTFPPGTTLVDVDGPGASTALESADLLIANTHTEVEWSKPNDTTYLQTWHGTPLKRIHRDVLWAPEGRLDRLDQDVARWDLLLSPNQVSTPRLRGAFHYEGEVLETGYPRNDVLFSSRGVETRARVRTELGVPPDTTVVLYTPTWRDQEAFAEGAPPVPVLLDVTAFAEALGEDHVLLVRSHNLVTGRSEVARTSGVIDVSMVPDVAELYCAADVLVTDYSSTMFDFAITGRPIVFLVPDLDHFRDVVRGFYFDLVPLAPGPLVRSTEGLIEVLRQLESWRASYAERYERFRHTFVGLEDGHATDRVLERLGL